MVMEIELRPNDLEQVVGSVFSTMMGIEVQAAGLESAGHVPEGALTAVVRFLGSWTGAVLVQCLPQQACEFAGSFLGMPAPDRVDADVRDVLGELANMIAGNLKCTLRPGIRISVPSVFDGEDTRESAAPLAYRSGFATAQGPFWLTVVEELSPD